MHYNLPPMSLSRRWSLWSMAAPGEFLKPLGSLERQVMERVWEHGETSVRDLQAQHFQHLAYTTLMTTLDRLYKKGLLQRRKSGRAFYYSAPSSREQLGHTLAQRVFGSLLGRAEPTHAAVLSSFVEAVSQHDASLLEELEQLVQDKRRTIRRD